MSKDIRVRLYATVEIRVPLVTTIDMDEYADWINEGGAPLDAIEPDLVLEFIKAGDVGEYMAGFPKADPDIHEVTDAYLDEAEILDVEETER